MKDTTLREAIELVGIETSRTLIHHVLPAFQIGDVSFFELTERWTLSRIVRTAHKFKSKNIVGFVTDIRYVENKTNVVMDWALGGKLPLLYFDGFHVYEVHWIKKEFKFGSYAFQGKYLLSNKFLPMCGVTEEHQDDLPF